MINIENIYADYDVIIEEFGSETIKNRYLQILTEMNAFIQECELSNHTVVSDMALMHAVMDYFTDISRLKEYHDIERTNDFKIKAYETYWLIQRKPIQLIKEMDDDKMFYINEKFVLSRLMPFLLGKASKCPLSEDQATAFGNFMDTLYYYLKFRRCDAQSIELMLIAFRAGMLFSEKNI